MDVWRVRVLTEPRLNNFETTVMVEICIECVKPKRGKTERKQSKNKKAQGGKTTCTIILIGVMRFLEGSVSVSASNMRTIIWTHDNHEEAFQKSKEDSQINKPSQQTKKKSLSIAAPRNIIMGCNHTGVKHRATTSLPYSRLRKTDTCSYYDIWIDRREYIVDSILSGAG